jgi:hypothetical protein
MYASGPLLPLLEVEIITSVSVATSPVRRTVERRPVEEKEVDIVLSVSAFLPQAMTLALIVRAVVTAPPPNLPVAGATIMVSSGRMLISERSRNGTGKTGYQSQNLVRDFGREFYQV